MHTNRITHLCRRMFHITFVSVFFLMFSLAAYGEANLTPSGDTVPAMAEPIQSDDAILSGGESGILRLHVIANSDGAEDQRIKYEVRDAITPYFVPSPTVDAATSMLLSDANEVQRIVDGVLEAENAAYGASLVFGVQPFPDRVYGEEIYPAGDYLALRVILGEGKGENWWCVLFPPLCILDEGSEDIEGSDEIVFESALF